MHGVRTEERRARLAPGAERARVSTVLRVRGMDCAGCARTIQAVAAAVPGVEEAEVDFVAGKLRVRHDPVDAPAAAIAERVTRAGYSATVEGMRPPARPASWWQQPRMRLLLVSAALLGAGLLAELAGVAGPGVSAVYALAVLVGGYYPVRSAWSSLRRRSVSINTLLVLATLGAVGLGLWGEAALLVVIFSLGEVLEAYAVDRARGAVRALVALVPTEATVLRGGVPLRVSTAEVAVGEVVRVRPGEKIPVDGVVVEGVSAVDQAPITGESIPVEKHPGSEVFAGTLNGRGSLDVRVSKPAEDTTIAKVVHLVEAAQRRKGRAQRFSERFGEVYTPIMLGVAGLVAVVPPLAFGEPFEGWLYRALVVLVVSCSCALVLSVPVAVVAGITSAARRGVMIKGGAYLEAIGGVRAVAFDKTGTLTLGRPEVTELVAAPGATEEEVLRMAAALEARSEHPLAEAILRAAEARGLEPPPVARFESITGRGVRGEVDGSLVFVGSPAFLEERAPLPASLREAVDRLQHEGKTVVLVGRADRLLGAVAVADGLKPNARAVVERLRALGIAHVVMLTGDNRRTAEAIGREAGVDEVRPELLPEDKIEAVRALQRRYGAIAMVGDGINDAPALAQADVGIAMGVMGTDVALETADIALMADDLDHLADAVEISRRTRANIRQNIGVALAAMGTLVTAALLGWMTVTEGLILNEGSALLVIANALRLLRLDERLPGGQAGGAP